MIFMRVDWELPSFVPEPRDRDPCKTWPAVHKGHKVIFIIVFTAVRGGSRSAYCHWIVDSIFNIQYSQTSIARYNTVTYRCIINTKLIWCQNKWWKQQNTIVWLFYFLIFLLPPKYKSITKTIYATLSDFLKKTDM